MAFAGDVSNEEFVQKTVDKIAKTHNIKYLFNNAAVGRFCKAEQNTRKIVDDVLAGSVIGTILMTTKVLPYMRKIEDICKIVSIISTAGIKGHANETAYNAAKWGERGYFEGLKVELKGTNIKPIAVFPGGINTPFWEDNRHYVNEKLQQNFMDPNELVQTIVRNVVNGNTLFVDTMVIEKTFIQK